MKTPPMTMRDLAHALGVSAMTVSRALRNSPGVGSEKRNWIIQEANRLGYQTHPYMSCLMADRRRHRPPAGVAVGMLILGKRETDTMGARHIREGCIQRAQELGYLIDEFRPNDTGITMVRLNKILKNRGIRGLLIPPPFPTSSAHLRLDWGHYAAVTMGFSLRFPDINCVAGNYALSIQLIVHHLRHAGYLRIGMALRKETDRKLGGNCTAAFLKYQDEIHTENRVPIFRHNLSNIDEVEQWMQRYRPDALIFPTEWHYQRLVQSGLSLPSDLGIAIFMRTEEGCDEFGINFSGTNVENHVIGAKAMDMLASQIEHREFGIPTHSTISLVRPTWVPGTTIRQGHNQSLREVCSSLADEAV